jgi:hypothetical protein
MRMVEVSMCTLPLRGLHMQLLRSSHLALCHTIEHMCQQEDTRHSAIQLNTCASKQVVATDLEGCLAHAHQLAVTHTQRGCVMLPSCMRGAHRCGKRACIPGGRPRTSNLPCVALRTNIKQASKQASKQPDSACNISRTQAYILHR